MPRIQQNVWSSKSKKIFVNLSFLFELAKITRVAYRMYIHRVAGGASAKLVVNSFIVFDVWYVTEPRYQQIW